MKFRSAVQQWGVLLLRMDAFKKNKCLCPTEYQGFQITPNRYQDMAFSLYQLLAQTTIIPSDFTDLRNIINRHASSQDGYRVLYDVMEHIHPHLDPDASYPLPQSVDTADIHDYFQQIDSYFMHERFAGRQYKPREQLNMFLRGLDPSYAPAVRRSRHIMDTWGPNDTKVPDILELSTLPNTIEKYMEEDGGVPVIRTMRNRNVGNRNSATRHPRLNTSNSDGKKPESRNFFDVRCDLCNMFGHVKYDCDRMATYLTLKDNEKKVDDKLQAKIQVNFSKFEDQRRLKKVNKLRGTVRQLYTLGQFEEGDQLWNDLFSTDIPNDATKGSDSDTSNRS